MSRSARAAELQLSIANELTVWTADNVLDLLGWPTYSSREPDCPMTLGVIPGDAWPLVRRAGVRIPNQCVVVAPMNLGDWKELLDELTAALPAAMKDLTRYELIFKQSVAGYYWPERYLLGLTIP